MTVDVLFISAHADDTELSCGGTAAKLVKDGLRVGLVDLTRGEMGTRGTPETRQGESQAAANPLGAAFRLTLDSRDGNPRARRQDAWYSLEVAPRPRPKLVIT